MKKALSVTYFVLAVSGSFFFTGCHAIYSTKTVPPKDIGKQGSFVFVRPGRHTLLGTRSLRDYTEVAYERFSINDAGQPVVKFGLRNRGGQRWYDTKGPRVTLSAKCVFYEDGVEAGAISSPPVYQTNWQRIPITRGETIHYEFVSPVAAGGYQITLSDAF